MAFHTLQRGLVIAAIATGIGVPSAFGQEADLSVTKFGPATAAANSDVSYTITVFNAGPDDAVTVALTDPIPSGMTFVSESQTSGPAFLCSNPPVGSPGTVTCTIATLASGSSADFTLVFHIPPATPPGTFFTNVASVTTATFDPNNENDAGVATTSTPPPPQGDMSVSKNGPNSAGPDTDVMYSISLTNGGPDDATNVALQDILPGTMTFVSLVRNSGPAMTCTTPAVGSGGSIDCTVATFAAGATVTFTLTGHIPSGTVSGQTFQNTATVKSDNDPNDENNATPTLLTVSSVDVSVTKSGPATSAAGTNISYTITVANGGPDTASVSLNDPLPPGTTFVSLAQDNGPPASCTPPPVGMNGTVVCEFTDLANGQSAQFTLVITPGPNTSVTNTASVTSDIADTNTANNTSGVTTTITQSADLGVTKSDSPDPVPAGANITYTINVTNNGPSNAQSVSLTDAVPANTTFVSFTAPAGWTASTPAVGGTGNVTATIPTLAAGASGTFTLVVATSAAETAGTTITNNATVATSTADPTTANDSATATTLIGSAQADLLVTKSDSPDPVAAGANITYTINVTNSGPSNAQSVSLTDAVPVNTTFVSFTAPVGWTPSTPAVGGTGNVTATIPTLAAGASGSFTLVVATSPGAASGTTITNTATVSSSTADPNALNNSATTLTIIGSGGQTDLSISKNLVPPSPVTPQDVDVTYNISVTNNGPGPATSVTVTDTLPANMTFVSATPSQGTCVNSPPVSCSLGSILSGASATITLVARSTTVLGPAVNTATVSSAEVDPNPANNTATATTTIGLNTNIPTLSPGPLLLLAAMLALFALVKMT